MNHIKFPAIATFILGTLLLSGTAFSGEDGTTRPQLIVKKVFVDLDANELLIYGNHFDNGLMPKVALADETLTVTEYSPDTIVAQEIPTVGALCTRGTMESGL